MNQFFESAAGYQIDRLTAGMLFGVSQSLMYREAKLFFKENSNFAIHDSSMLYQLIVRRYRETLPTLAETQDFADLVLHAMWGSDKVPQHLITREKPLLVVFSNSDAQKLFKRPDRIKCSDSTIQKWIRSGKLPQSLRPGESPRVWSFEQIYKTRFALGNGGQLPTSEMTNIEQYRFLRWKFTSLRLQQRPQELSVGDRAMLFAFNNLQ